MGSALFDIENDGEDHGYAGTNGQSFSLKLRNPNGVGSVMFQVYREGSDPALGIAANPPRASSDAPLITLVGTSSGGAVSPATPAGEVEGTLPVSGAHSYIIRCVVDRGQRTLPNGRVVVDPSLVHERGIYIPAGDGLRKIVATETNQFGLEGWAQPMNALIANGTTSGSFLPPGSGAVARSVSSRLSEDIYVTDFMTEEERAAVFAPNDITFPVNHQPAIQKAIDYAMYRSAGPGVGAGPSVVLPGGVYRIDDTLHLGYGTEFRGVQFRGAGMREGGNFDVSGTGTVIIATFNDRPAIAIQGARSTVVDGMTIVQQRQGAHILGVAQNDAANMAHLDPAAWVDPTFPASASSQYAPLCAIAIDPYSGVRPGVSYPDVTYPAHMGGGAVPQYGKLHSRNVLIQNVHINGFVVGVALQPCNDDANGDFVKLRRVSFRFCVWGYSWGNTQARVNALYDGVFAYVHTALTTTRHGRQTGNPQIAVYSTSFEIGMQICEILNLNYGQGPTFTGCFAESMYSIGKLQGGNAFRTGGARFQSCEFGFTWWTRYGVPTYVLIFDGTTMQCVLDNCFFYMAATRGGYLAFKGSGADDEPAKSFRLTNCQRDGQDIDITDEYQRAAFNATMGIVVSRGSTCMDRFSVSSGHVSNIDTGAQETPRLNSEWQRAARVNCANVYATHIKALSAGADPGVPVRWKSAILPGAELVELDGRLLTVDMPGITTASLAQTGGDVGDVLVSTNNGVAFLVRSRTGTELLLEAMTGYDKDEELLESLPAECTFVPIHCRRYSIPTVVYADMTEGSDTLTNVLTGPGSYADIPANFTIGDYLVVDGDVDRCIQPQHARLASYDNGTKTLTFDGVFMYTQARRRITLWSRPPLPNVAA